MRGIKLVGALLLVGLLLPVFGQAASIQGPPQFDVLPVQFRTVRLDQAALLALLAQAPLEGTPAAATGAVTLALPLPDGSFGRFRLVESPIMAPALAARFPDQPPM